MRIILAIMVLLLSSFALAPISASDSNDPLADWQWNKRLLVLCLPNDESMESLKTITIYQTLDWNGFAEYELLYVELRKNDIHTVIGNRKNNSSFWRHYLHDESYSEIRSRSNCQNDFEFVLFGKDGTVKKRWQNYVSFEDIYATIDAMPMRQREMREQKEQ